MLRRTFGLTLAFVTTALLSAGCGGPVAPSPAPGAPAAPSGGPAATEGPVTPKVNRVVFAVEPFTTEGWDVWNMAASSFLQVRPIYEYMINLDPNTGKYLPGLATDWSVEPNGQSVRFKLRKGVQFHFGNGEFTSRDLEQPFLERIKPGNPTGQSTYWRNTLDRIDKVNDYEAVYHLKRADGTFIVSMSEQRGGMEMFSSAAFQKLPAPTLQTGPVAGSGPWQYKSRTAVQNIVFERAPYKHWRVTPDFPEVEVRFMKEPSSRLAALVTGELHVTSLPEDLLKSAEGRGMKVVKGRVPGLRTLISMYCCYPVDPKDASKGTLYPDSPLVDPRVRRALSKATDRDALNKAFFGGKGDVMVQSHLHASKDAWDSSWDRRFKDEYGYDLEAAKKLLADAGYGPGKPFQTNLLVQAAAGYSGAQDVAEALAIQWKAAGVDTKLVQGDPAAIGKQRDAMQLSNHMGIIGTSADIFTGLTNYGSTVDIRGRGVELLDEDRLINQVLNTLDQKKIDEIWKQIGEVMFVQHHDIPLFWLPTQAAINPTFVADYVFPGSISGAWTHLENLKAAK